VARVRRRVEFAFGWIVLVLVAVAVGLHHVVEAPPRAVDLPALKRGSDGPASIAAQLAFLLELNRQRWLTGVDFDGPAGNADHAARNEVASHEGAGPASSAAVHPACDQAAQDSLPRAAGAVASPAGDAAPMHPAHATAKRERSKRSRTRSSLAG